MTCKQIIYPGTFDPITNGHIDLVRRASCLFDEVIVAVAVSTKKQTIFTLDERESLVKKVLEEYSNVVVCSFSGLLLKFCKERGAWLTLRGLRAVSDFEYELQLANVNRMMDARMETVFLTPGEKYAYISASMVREIAFFGGDVSFLVPPIVQQALAARAKNRGTLSDGDTN